MDAGLFWAGQVQGLISDVPTVGSLVQRIMDDAVEIIRERLDAYARMAVLNP